MKEEKIHPVVFAAVHFRGGGEFGPEASLYTLVFWALVTVGLLWLARRRGQLTPRRSKRADAVALVP